MWKKLALIGLCSAFSLSARAEKQDAWVTTQTKLALWTTSGISSSEVEVDTVGGIVTLHGKVSSAADKASAEREAHKIEGVKSVRNLLQVVPDKREQAVTKNDKEIKDSVEAALKAQPSLADIKVKSVNAGVVLLAGTVDDLGEQERAVRCAFGVRGVHRVASEIKGSTDQIYLDGDVETGMPAAHKPATSPMRDGWTTTEVKLRLMANEKIASTDVNVDTRDRVVTLFGIVPSATAKAAAESEARRVTGVTRVVNDLQIVPSSEKSLVKTEDKEVERQVRQAIDARAELRGVSVMVKGGAVRLTGSVASRMDRLEASTVSRSQRGVRFVDNALTVKQKRD